MLIQDLIGLESKPAGNRIEAEAVRRFAEALGIPYTGQVPPTFVITLRCGSFPGVNLHKAGMIHGEQKFTYYLPISVGDTINCTQRIKAIFQKSGKLGKMTFIVREIEGRNPAGELVFTGSATLIAPEEVDLQDEVS